MTRFSKVFLLICVFAVVNPAIAQIVLRQSTAVDIGIGPAVDSTDGVTPETALTISQADVRLKKNGGAWAQKNDANACTHEENGWYECALNATDTDTVGTLIVNINEAGALQIRRIFQVIEEAVYDQQYVAAATGLVPANVTQFNGVAATSSGGRPEVNTTHFAGTAFASAVVPANAIQISGDATAADNLEAWLDLQVGANGAFPWAGIAASGTAQAYTAGTPSVTLAASTAYGDDDLNGMTIWVRGATTDDWVVGSITDYVGSTDVATLSAAFANAPTGALSYIVWGTAALSAGGGSADWTATEKNQMRHRLGIDGTTAAPAATPSLATAAAVQTIDDLVDDLEGRVGTPSNLGSGATLSANNVDIEGQTDDIGAAGAGLTAILTPLGVIDDFLDSEIAAILAKVNPLTFTVTNQVDVNVESMNANAVCGTGDTGTPWIGCP